MAILFLFLLFLYMVCRDISYYTISLLDLIVIVFFVLIMILQNDIYYERFNLAVF
jgi:uncharacterized membrane protein YoaK (UPF0700 family)